MMWRSSLISPVCGSRNALAMALVLNLDISNVLSIAPRFFFIESFSVETIFDCLNINRDARCDAKGILRRRSLNLDKSLILDHILEYLCSRFIACYFCALFCLVILVSTLRSALVCAGLILPTRGGCEISFEVHFCYLS